MKVSDVYEQYEVMPQLREHHFRVAAVGEQICENFDAPINTEAVVEALLVHDLANILKFDLSYFPEFVEPEGLAYWEEVKRRTAETYGTDDEHVATRKMAGEIGISVEALDCLDAIGFSQVVKRLDDPSYERKVCCYADQRVAPHGVVSMQDRIAEGQKRYANHPKGVEKFHRLAEALGELEQQIFERARIKPEDITEESIAGRLRELPGVSVGRY